MARYDLGFQEEVESLLTIIAKNKDLIARAYCSPRGAEYSPEEEQSLRILRQLGLAKQMVDGEFRLSRQLRDVINRGISRHHISDINTSLGNHLNHYRDAIDAYTENLSKDDLLKIESAKDDVSVAFFDITDFFLEASKEIDIQVRLAVGNYAYGNDRISIIKKHIIQLDKLHDAYEHFIKILDDEIYLDYEFLDNQARSFKSHTIEYLDQAEATRKEIDKVLTMRELSEKRTQKLRYLHAYLRRKPTASFSIAREKADQFQYFLCAKRVKVQSSIELNTEDPKWIQQCTAILDSLGKKKPIEKPKFDRPTSGSTKAIEMTKRVESNKAINMINDLIKHIYKNKTAVSIIEFKNSHPLSGFVRDDYWLHISRTHINRLKKLSNVDRKSEKLKAMGLLSNVLKIMPLYKEYEKKSGNRIVKDVIVSHAHTDNDFLANIKSRLQSANNEHD